MGDDPAPPAACHRLPAQLDRLFDLCRRRKGPAVTEAAPKAPASPQASRGRPQWGVRQGPPLYTRRPTLPLLRISPKDGAEVSRLLDGDATATSPTARPTWGPGQFVFWAAATGRGAAAIRPVRGASGEVARPPGLPGREMAKALTSRRPKADPDAGGSGGAARRPRDLQRRRPAGGGHPRSGLGRAGPPAARAGAAGRPAEGRQVVYGPDWAAATPPAAKCWPGLPGRRCAVPGAGGLQAPAEAAAATPTRREWRRRPLG